VLAAALIVLADTIVNSVKEKAVGVIYCSRRWIASPLAGKLAMLAR